MAARTNKPVLLAGGNPQIPTGEGEAPVAAWIEALPGWKREAARRLDGVISGAVPEVRKAVKWNSPFYGIDGQGWFLAIHAYTRYLKVAFFCGASLEPMPPVGSKSGRTRYLHLHEGDPSDEAQVTEWVRQAVKWPGFLAPKA